MRGNESLIERARQTETEQTETGSPPDWRTVDRALRAIAMRRAGLDAEELHWLREAEALQIWRPLGMVSALDYLERVFGYTPRVAEERLRVSRALGALPWLDAELASGQLPFTAVRELTRIATPDTEADWIAAVRGKNVRQIEELVSGHRPGDHPDDPTDPEVRTHVVRFELAAPTFALLRQARLVLDDEHGRRLADDELIAALCHAVLEGAPATEPSGRAKFQIGVTVCERCERGWQDGGGTAIPIDAVAVERARCDAQHIGSLDGDAPERAYQDIPPSTVRFVWRRDHGRCRVPGCRSARGLEIHHLVHRADGGSHDPSNLILACSACHLAHHRGALQLSGTADRLVVRRPGEAHVQRPRGTQVGEIGTAARATDGHDHLQANHEAVGNDRGTAAAAGAKVSPAGSRRSHVEIRHSARGANGRSTAALSIPQWAPVAKDCTSDHSPHVGASRANGLAPIRAAAPASDDSPHVGASRANELAPIRAAAPASDDSPHVGANAAGEPAASRLDAAMLRVQGKQALVGMGWKPAVASAAVAAAAAATGPGATLEQLIFEALRRCQRPSSRVQNPLRAGGSSSSASYDSTASSSKW